MDAYGFTAKRLFLSLSLAFLIPVTAAIAHEWMAPKDAARMKNPIAADADSVARGKELFLDNCASCHGDDAQGLPADEAGLQKNAPNLPQRLRNHTDGDFFWKIQHGRGEMPSFQGSLTDEEIWDTINFIRHN